MALLPQFKRSRPATSTVQALQQLESNVAEFAAGLVGERGLLRSGAPLRGRMMRLEDVTAPDGWLSVTLGGTWVAHSTGRAPRVRKGPDGEVEFSGLIKSGVYGFSVAAVPFTGAQATLAPSRVRSLGVTSDPYGYGTVEVDPAGIYAVNGGAGWISLDEVRYTATDRTPPDWPTASHLVLNLGPDFPGEPAFVRVEDVRTSAGVHLGPFPAKWTAERSGKQWVVTIKNVLGLPPGGPYSLGVAVLTA